MKGSIGLGLLLGPLAGGLLYYLGGYTASFWTVGIICLLILPLLKKAVDEISTQEQVNEAKRTVLAYASELNKAQNLLEAIRDTKVELPRHRRVRSEDQNFSAAFFSA